MTRTHLSSARLFGACVAGLLVGGLSLSGCASDDASAPTTTATATATSASTPSEGAGSDVASTPSTAAATPSSAMEVGDASPSVTATVAAPTESLKKASTAELPTTLAGLKGQLFEQDANTSVGQYTGTTEDQMLVATLTKGQQRSAALALLSEPVTEGHTTCGTIQTTGLVGCYLWLDGGNIQLFGSNQTTTAELRSDAEELWDSLS
ncbi:hypothetical protein [Luteococcus sanguinis]|uniref:DUF4367 domain-containing protein n=1 Tax=Luteococcus sanguinis TaxID=174038 RepID=A0ABW1X0K7_9ACTN